MLLVTGITGHTGRYFLQEMIDHGYQEPVRCTVRESSDTKALDVSGLAIEKAVGDLNDRDFIDSIMPGVDTVLHIYNIHHSPDIVESAIRNQVKRVILVHTTGIFSRFKKASQEYKEIEEQIRKMAEDPDCKTGVTILRPTMIYGDLCDHNISRFIKFTDKLKIVPIINNGNSLIQPVNARDLGKAYYRVLVSPAETSGKAYTLSGDKPIKMIDMYKTIAAALNKKVVFLPVPLFLGVLPATVLKAVTLGKIDYIERVQRMGEDRSYPHDEAAKDFGYDPMPFETGIRIETQQYLGDRAAS